MFAFVIGQTEFALKRLNLDWGYKNYKILNHVENADKDREKFEDIMNTIKAFMSITEFDVVNRLATAILKLGNMRTSVAENKNKVPAIHDLLRLNNPKFFKFLLMNKEGMILNNKDYAQRIEALMECLYITLVNFIVDKVNTRFKTQYYEKFSYEFTQEIYPEEEIRKDSLKNSTLMKTSKIADVDKKKMTLTQSIVGQDKGINLDNSKKNRNLSSYKLNLAYEMLKPRPSLVFIDSFGYVDLNRYGDYSEHNDNGFHEFTSNYFYESFLNFFNNYRYDRVQKEMENEKVGHLYKKIPYLNNNQALENIQTLESILNKNEDKKQIILEVQLLFPTFFKNVLKNLKPRTEGSEDESKEKRKHVRKRSSTSPRRTKTLNTGDFLIESMLDNAKAAKEEETVNPDLGTEYLVMEHSFAEFINYDLNDLYTKNKFAYYKKVRNFVYNSGVVNKIFVDTPDKSNSRLLKQSEEQKELFEFLSNSNIYFFYCLKIPNSKSEQQRNNAVFLQFRSLDYESLVENQMRNFPYKLNYPFFLQKFNVLAKIAQINPSLNIPYNELVRNILTNMFANSSDSLFACGTNNLYVREKFYFEIDSLLKESSSRSRIMAFVEQAIKEIAAKHIDNTSVVVKMARKFLVEKCGANKFNFFLKSKEKFVKAWRKYKMRVIVGRVSLEIVDLILNKIDYYNPRKLKYLQAYTRGMIDRKKNFPKESHKVGQMMFDNKFQKLRKQIKTTFKQLLLNNKSLMHQNNISFESKIQMRLLRAKKLKIDAVNGIKPLGIAIKWGLVKSKLKKLLTVCYKRQRAAKMIKSFLGFVVKSNKVYYEEQRKGRNQILEKQTERQKEFSRSLNRYLNSKGLPKLPLQAIEEKEEPVIKKKADLGLHIISIEVMDEVSENPDAFCKNLANILGAVYKEELLKIELSENETSFYTQKQKLIIFKNSTQKTIEMKIPSKTDRYGMLNNYLLYVEESGILKSKEVKFSLPNPGHDFNEESFESGVHENENIFGFTKFKDFCVRKDNFLGSSECRKVCYKEDIFDLANPARVFQFKRPISHLALGEDFMIAADETGVVYSVGRNSSGQLGLGHFVSSNSLQIVKRLLELKEVVKSISCGSSHVLALTANNKVFGWGNNYWFQLGERVRNFTFRVKNPREITPHLGIEKDIKFQIACGKNSSFVLTSNKKLVKIGRVAASKIYEKPEIQILGDLAPQGVYSVGIDVQWNSFFEIVSIRNLDVRNSVYDKTSTIIPFAASLFEVYSKNPHISLIQYNESFGKVLPLTALNSKLVELHNKKDVNKLSKMVENFLFIK